jgi:hypothetical protein
VVGGTLPSVGITRVGSVRDKDYRGGGVVL